MSQKSSPKTAPSPEKTSSSQEKVTSPPKAPEAAPESFFSRCRGFVARWGWIALLAIPVFLVGYYTLFPSRGFFHSDTTDSMMWAVASHESGSLFNRDFNYACLLPFSTSLIMTALIPIFGVSMTTHTVSMLLFALLFTGALVWMLRKMDWQWSWIAFAVFIELMICSGSGKLREIFWGHSIYYSLGVLFVFAGLALLFRFLDLLDNYQSFTVDKSPAKKKAGYFLLLCAGVLLLWCLLTGMDQITSITIFALPVMAAVFAERWLDEGTPILSKKNLPALLLILVMGVGTVLGYVLTAVLSHGITAGYESGYSTYSAMSEWVTNLQSFPQAWFSLLGADMADHDPILSLKSVGDLLIIITGVVLLVLPVVALFSYRKMDRKMRILLLTYWFMFLLLMMGYVMGRLSSANWRLSPVVALSAVVCVAYMRWAIPQIKLQRVASLLMIPVMAVSVINAVALAAMPADNTADNELYTLANELENRGLTYGYATFWQANAVTIISDSKVECRSVNVDDWGCTPYRYQNCDSWFDDQPGVEKYFLVLTKAEKQKLVELSDPLVASHKQEFQAGSFSVWVFNENIF